MARSDDLKTPLCRLAWADGLFKVKADDFGKNWWTCSLLFPKGDDLVALKKAALQACEAEWPGKASEWLQSGVIKNPFLDGDGKQGRNKNGEPHAGFPGTKFIRVKSGEEYRPKLVNQKVLPITSQDDLYSGCYGFAVVHAYTWDNEKQGKGVSFGIGMFQKAKDGERLGGGGGVDVDKWAEKIEDAGDAPAETKGGKGAEALFG